MPGSAAETGWDLAFCAGQLAALGVLGDHVAHDLRNSVGNVLGFVQLLSLQETDRTSQAISRQARRCADLTQILPAYGRDPRRPVEPMAILRDAARRARAHARLHGVRLVLLPPPEELPGLQVVPLLVRQALQNLIANAVEASPPRSTVTLHARVEPPGVELGVSYAGHKGKPRDVLARILRPFLQAAAADLGITLARHHIAYHDGRLTLDTLQGHARIWLPLPVSR